jgi:hypothetical protein
VRAIFSLRKQHVEGRPGEFPLHRLALFGSSALTAGLAAAALLLGDLTSPLRAEPNPAVTRKSLVVGVETVESPAPANLISPASSQHISRTPVEGPTASGTAAENSIRNDHPTLNALETKPSFYTVIEQTTGWTFPSTGARWGTGAGNGSTLLGLGVKGKVRVNGDTFMKWSLQTGPVFQHVYNVPGNDRTPLRTDAYISISPGVGGDLNVYGAWRGLFGTDVYGQNRVQNTAKTGIVYSFSKSRIVADAIEQINIPEQGFYGRIEPTWIFALDDQLAQVQTQVYVGFSKRWHPFSFAIEVGPQFV